MTTNSADVLRRFAPQVSEALVARLAAWVPGSEVVAARPAASVILMRESGLELETYLLHRHARMPFAAVDGGLSGRSDGSGRRVGP